MFKVMLAALTVPLLILPNTAGADQALRAEAANLFGRIEAPPPGKASAEQELGRALCWDTRASLDVNTACASCRLASD